MVELSECVDHLQQENDCLWTRLESNRPENPQGVAQNVPPARVNKGKELALLDHSYHQADVSSLWKSLHFHVAHNLRAMRKPNPERDLLASPVRL